MRMADIITAMVLAAVGVLVLADAIRLGFGWTPDGPQAGFFPFLLGLGVVVGCAIVVVQAVQRKGVAKSEKPFIPPKALTPVILVVAPAALMVILTEFIGLYLAAALYLGTYMRLVGHYRWRLVLSLSILVPITTYLVFDKIFLIPMPTGMYGRLLPF
ncbi:MAG: hypothetical protein A2Z31_01385 [candidate division NC10 bacterium RBG_16_65_8]|nr:MAG: hypothetical protein A2Z31_01385 [candidate division NC10 bacterium RBG_16_65_8]